MFGSKIEVKLFPINFYNAISPGESGCRVSELDGRLGGLLGQKQGAEMLFLLVAGDFNCHLCPSLLPLGADWASCALDEGLHFEHTKEGMELGRVLNTHDLVHTMDLVVMGIKC